MKKFLYFITLLFILVSCGKVGPLNLPEDKIDKSLISYPCDENCMERLEDEKKRQQSVIIQTE